MSFSQQAYSSLSDWPGTSPSPTTPAPCPTVLPGSPTTATLVTRLTVRQNARSILSESPVDYVRDMELRGSLFDDKCTICAVSLRFYKFLC